MSSRSNKGSSTGCPPTVTTKGPLSRPEDTPKQSTPESRVKTRRPRDPRKPRKVAVRPPRKNPLIGKVEPYRNERILVYEPEEYAEEEEK